MATILVAEDEPDIAEFTMRQLKRRDFQVLRAENGQEAVDMAAEQSPDAIVMDLRMPVMDGFDATRAIKSNPTTRNIGIIVLTADLMGAQEQAFECGCDDIDEKPIDGDRLAEKVRALIKNQEQQHVEQR